MTPSEAQSIQKMIEASTAKATAATNAKIDQAVADIRKMVVGPWTDSAGTQHYLRTWLTKLAGKSVDLP